MQPAEQAASATNGQSVSPVACSPLIRPATSGGSLFVVVTAWLTNSYDNESVDGALFAEIFQFRLLEAGLA